MTNEFKNRNKVARIRFNEFNKFIVSVYQISNDGIRSVEDSVSLKTGISTYNRAKKYALKQIG